MRTDEPELEAPEHVARDVFGRGIRLILSYVRALGIGIRRYFSGVMGSSVAASLRDRVSDRYRDLSLSYHRGQPTGELLAHMEADVEASIEVIYPVPFSVGVILLVVFALISLVVTDPFLTLVGLVVIPTLGLMNH